jgi:hypothetical protein
MQAWVYEIQVVGRLSDSDLAKIHAEVGERLTTTAEPVSTLIRGSVADQSALIGLLNLLHALGLKVYELRRLTDLESDTDAQIASFSPGDVPGMPST